jgi:hypothetical protein
MSGLPVVAITMPRGWQLSEGAIPRRADERGGNCKLAIDNYQFAFRRQRAYHAYFFVLNSVRKLRFVWPTIPDVRPPTRACSPAVWKLPVRPFASCSDPGTPAPARWLPATSRVRRRTDDFAVTAFFSFFMTM